MFFFLGQSFISRKNIFVKYKLANCVVRVPFIQQSLGRAIKIQKILSSVILLILLITCNMTVLYIRCFTWSIHVFCRLSGTRAILDKNQVTTLTISQERNQGELQNKKRKLLQMSYYLKLSKYKILWVKWQKKIPTFFH